MNITEGSQEDIDQLVGEAYFIEGLHALSSWPTYMDSHIPKTEHQQTKAIPHEAGTLIWKWYCQLETP